MVVFREPARTLRSGFDVIMYVSHAGGKAPVRLADAIEFLEAQKTGSPLSTLFELFCTTLSRRPAYYSYKFMHLASAIPLEAGNLLSDSRSAN